MVYGEQTKLCLDYLQKHLTGRSDEIAAAAGLTATQVSATLARFVDNGTLVMCKVERPGAKPVNEYRFSAVGGGQIMMGTPVAGGGKNGKPYNPKPLPQPRAEDMLDRGAELGRKENAAPQVPAKATSGVRVAEADSPTVNRLESTTRVQALIASPAGAASTSSRLGAIEKGIPIPLAKNGNGELRALLSQLEVGDSFLTSYSRTACYRMAKAIGIQVLCRPEGEAGDERCWRSA